MDCPDPGDSPLSTTGNVLGILTFALGLFAYCIAFSVVVRGADRELAAALATLVDTARQIAEVKQFLDDEEREADPDYRTMKDMIDSSESSYKAAKYEFESQLEPFIMSPHGNMSFLGRFRWWYREKDLAAAATRLENRKQHFATIQLTYLLR